MGKMKFFGSSMGVYRIHENGVFACKDWSQQFQFYISGAMAVSKLLDEKYRELIISHNAGRLFEEGLNKYSSSEITLKEMAGIYLSIDDVKWRRNILIIFLYVPFLRSLFLQKIARFFFKEKI